MSKLFCAGLAALALLAACTDAGRSVDCAGSISMGGASAMMDDVAAAFPMNGGQFSLYLMR
ncbi:hypothetical protein AB4Z48_16840 [Cupriavidus sp. 2TAF22]|uniref:hypothetical protein n=1 Tax=unclassified Cupriavidus TaxID=2640874 RepID=UPI003F919A4C